MIRAGADARPITPSLVRPVFLAGFQGDRRATGAHLDLNVRTLALQEDDGPPFVLAVCDVIGVLRPDTLRIRAGVADLEADVVVAATHTHSGPDTIGLWGPDPQTSGVDDGYLSEMCSAVEASIRAAVAALEPAQIRPATTTLQGVIRNLRDPEILDEEVAALAIDRPDASTIATLVNVPVHPEVLDGSSTLISPDMAGAAARAMEVARGGVGIWASAGLGGMQSPVEGPIEPEEAERKGALCAAAALSALVAAPVVDDARVRYRSAEVTLPLDNPRFSAAMASGLIPDARSSEGSLVTEAGILDLGAARMVMWPGEVLPELGVESKRRLDTAYPFLIGLANDEIGYILPPDRWVDPGDWDDPGPQYEETMSVGPETGPRILAALDALLAD